MSEPGRSSGGGPAGARGRLLVVGVVLLGLFALAAARATYLQVVRGPELRARVERQRLRLVRLHPVRGPIYDRNGRELAQTLSGSSVFVDPDAVLGRPDALRNLCRVLGLDRAAVAARLEGRGRRFTWLKRGVSPGEAEAVQALGLTGVGVVREPQRYYPKRSLAGQVLGFVGVDGRGLGGIEYRFDEVLRGQQLEVEAERDARGRLLLARPPDLSRSAGRGLVLTLDEAIQHIAEEELDKAVRKSNARGGMAVVIEPSTGDVLALAQVPAFNPNTYRSSTPEQRKVRAVVDVFEPGSTLKALFLGILLDRGLARPADRVFCENGTWQVYDRTIHDHKPHGWLTVADVLKVSSNIGVAKLSERIPPRGLYEGLAGFGLGRVTGIELGGESRGLFPEPKAWSKLTPITVSYGQGVSATALQVAVAFAAIANDGMRMRPRLVRAVVDDRGREIRRFDPEPAGRAVAAATAQTLTRLLERVVEEDGTAPLAAVPGYRVAGKTGTAWKPDPVRGGYRRDRVVASFVGSVPSRRPRLTILVAVDEPRRGSRYGGMVAGPAFREMARRILGYLEVSPDLPGAAEPSAEGVARRPRQGRETPPGTMPDLRGLTMRQVLRRVSDTGVETRVSLLGSGVAESQDPAPGAPLTPGQVCSVVFRPLL